MKEDYIVIALYNAGAPIICTNTIKDGMIDWILYSREEAVDLMKYVLQYDVIVGCSFKSDFISMVSRASNVSESAIEERLNGKNIIDIAKDIETANDGKGIPLEIISQGMCIPYKTIATIKKLYDNRKIADMLLYLHTHILFYKNLFQIIYIDNNRVSFTYLGKEKNIFFSDKVLTIQ